MEPSYAYNAKEGWYKPDGQSQTVRMRRTSLGTASLSTTSQPNSRTGTLDSDRAGRENRDPNARKPSSRLQSQPRAAADTYASNPDATRKRAEWAVPSPPSSQGSGLSGGGGSMEKALLPKRPEQRPHRTRGRGETTAAATAGGRGRVPGRIPGTAIYRNELAPNGSWYHPKKPKDKSSSVESETGLMKIFLNTFKKKNKVANSPPI